MDVSIIAASQHKYMFTWGSQQFELYPNKYIFWKNTHALILSDVHLGKAQHFQKHGIAVSQQVHTQDLHDIEMAIQATQAKQLIIVGDLFHSTANKGHEDFELWLNKIKVPVELVLGNHDAHTSTRIRNLGIAVYQQSVTINNVVFIHEMPTTRHDDLFYIAGHEHPAIMCNLLPKKSMRLPCFVLGNNYCKLPSFGKFTGSKLIKPLPSEQIIYTAQNNLYKL